MNGKLSRERKKKDKEEIKLKRKVIKTIMSKRILLHRRKDES